MEFQAIWKLDAFQWTFSELMMDFRSIGMIQTNKLCHFENYSISHWQMLTFGGKLYPQTSAVKDAFSNDQNTMPGYCWLSFNLKHWCEIYLSLRWKIFFENFVQIRNMWKNLKMIVVSFLLFYFVEVWQNSVFECFDCALLINFSQLSHFTLKI